MIDKVVESFLPVETLKKELENKIGKGISWIKYLIDDGLQNYAQNLYKKYSKIKTFVYRNDLHDFYEIYYPTGLYMYNPGGKSIFIEKDQITNKLFNQSNCITILGNAGAGKSMLVKHLFISYLNTKNQIPIVIELRNLNIGSNSFEKYIKNSIFNNELCPEENIIDDILSLGKFLFILDGYDEVHSNRSFKLTKELNEFIDKYSRNLFLITSRHGTHVESLPRFMNFQMEPLHKQDIEPFIYKQFYDKENREQRTGRLMDIINTEKNRDHMHYLTNPLLLSMFIYTYLSHPDMPRHRSAFYEDVVDTLCTTHDNISKQGDLHEKKTNFEKRQFIKILGRVSRKSLFKGVVFFSESQLKDYLFNTVNAFKMDCKIDDLFHDLTVSISIIVKDGPNYQFPHRTLQEYFTAFHIAKLSEERRREFYNNKYYKIALNQGTNLWTLSQEIDTHLFCTVIRDNLLNIYDTLTSGDSNSRHLNYFKIAKLKLFIQNDKITDIRWYIVEERAIILLRYLLGERIHQYRGFVMNPTLKRGYIKQENIKIDRVNNVFDSISEVTVNHESIHLSPYLIGVGFKSELEKIICLISDKIKFYTDLIEADEDEDDDDDED